MANSASWQHSPGSCRLDCKLFLSILPADLIVTNTAHRGRIPEALHGPVEGVSHSGVIPAQAAFLRN